MVFNKLLSVLGQTELLEPVAKLLHRHAPPNPSAGSKTQSWYLVHTKTGPKAILPD
jgi:hypothetical protein